MTWDLKVCCEEVKTCSTSKLTFDTSMHVLIENDIWYFKTFTVHMSDFQYELQLLLTAMKQSRTWDENCVLTGTMTHRRQEEDHTGQRESTGVTKVTYARQSVPSLCVCFYRFTSIILHFQGSTVVFSPHSHTEVFHQGEGEDDAHGDDNNEVVPIHEPVSTTRAQHTHYGLMKSTVDLFKRQRVWCVSCWSSRLMMRTSDITHFELDACPRKAWMTRGNSDFTMNR